MAPVATESVTKPSVADLKAANGNVNGAGVQVFNPFYSPDAGDADDSDYKFAKYKVRPFDGRSRLVRALGSMV